MIFVPGSVELAIYTRIDDRDDFNLYFPVKFKERGPLAVDGSGPSGYFSRTVAWGFVLPCLVVTYRPLIALR